MPLLVYCQHLHRHTHACMQAQNWQDIYSCPTGLWQVMRGPTVQDIIILLYGFIKKERSPLTPWFIWYFAYAHTNALKHTNMYKDVPDCNKGKLSATPLLFVGLQLHCDNKNAENATQSSLLKKYFPSCLLNYKLYSKKNKPPAAILMTAPSSNCLW